jgi:hypothetical protein
MRTALLTAVVLLTALSAYAGGTDEKDKAYTDTVRAVQDLTASITGVKNKKGAIRNWAEIPNLGKLPPADNLENLQDSIL